jgi:hypothetical protein
MKLAGHTKRRPAMKLATNRKRESGPAAMRHLEIGNQLFHDGIKVEELRNTITILDTRIQEFLAQKGKPPKSTDLTLAGASPEYQEAMRAFPPKRATRTALAGPA